jgi:hypothetical protein
VGKTEDAAQVLAALGLPPKQQNERSALTLLALAKLAKHTPWSGAEQPMLRTVDIMDFMRTEYDKDYKPNSRETIRRQTLHQFEQARVVDINKEDPSRATNSGLTAYSLTDEALLVVRLFGTPTFGAVCARFIAKHGSLLEAYNKRRTQHSVPLLLPDGKTVQLSAGKHNELQAAIIEQFGPRFAPGARVLYVGDTAKKHVVCDAGRLAALGVPITEHDMLPDVILYLEEKKWLFLIEAVTTHGPVSPKRYTELEKALAGSSCERVYVSAFRDGKTFRKYASDIAWETEVWIAESPEHMIHFNGPKFLGPYTPR